MWAELVFPDAQLMMDYLSKARDHWQSLMPRSPSPVEEETFEQDSGEDTPHVETPKEQDESERNDESLQKVRRILCMHTARKFTDLNHRNNKITKESMKPQNAMPHKFCRFTYHFLQFQWHSCSS